MLLRFSVEGYRGFSDKLTFDLTKTRDYTYNTKAINSRVVKDALVYGRNGMGKTNLGKAMLDARYNVARETLGFRADSAFLNADEERKAARFSYTTSRNSTRPESSMSRGRSILLVVEGEKAEPELMVYSGLPNS